MNAPTDHAHLAPELHLREVPAALSVDAIVTKGRAAIRGLQRQFGLGSPRIAVAGLNPHAGEEGTLGREEVEIIVPAIERLKEDGHEVSGPHPPDIMFYDRRRRNYDAALCMYHDQALIPLKTLHFDEGINVTLGLPIVRTSPDHGTAFDIAGKALARPDSLMAALRLADRLARTVATMPGGARADTRAEPVSAYADRPRGAGHFDPTHIAIPRDFPGWGERDAIAATPVGPAAEDGTGPAPAWMPSSTARSSASTATK